MSSPDSARQLQQDTGDDRGKRLREDSFCRAFGPYLWFRGGTQIIAKPKVMKYSFSANRLRQSKHDAQRPPTIIISSLDNS
jgi:hypothetical protein